MSDTEDIEDDGIRVACGLADGSDFWMGEQAREAKLPVPSKFADQQTNEFIASTGREARDGDIIEQSSWQLGDFRRNPVILDNHYGQNVGRSLATRLVDGDLRALVLWNVGSPRGAEVAALHAGGWRSAVSVRWITGKRTARNELPKDHPAYSEGREIQSVYGGSYRRVGSYLQRCTLLEISSVDIPSDTGATMVRALQASGVVEPARSLPLLDQLPDDGMRREITEAVRSALLDPSLAEDDRFRALVVDSVIRACREGDASTEVLRAVLGALASDLPLPARAPKGGKPSITDWLRVGLQRTP